MFLQVPELGWESMMVVVTPQDVGRPTARTERTEVADGACRWPAPIFETTTFRQGGRRRQDLPVPRLRDRKRPRINHQSKATALDLF